jgi:hypothetical protein
MENSVAHRLQAGEENQISGETPLPLSFLEEERLSFECRLPDCLPFNGSVGFELIGSLDTGVLQDTLDLIIARHEVLRTSFHRDMRYRLDVNGPVSYVFTRSIGSCAAAPLVIHDLETCDAEAAAAAARAVSDEMLSTRFDYTETPQLRAALLRMGRDRNLLILVVPHLISDGVSLRIIQREFRTWYRTLNARGHDSNQNLRCQYVDFASWQRSRLRGSLLRNLGSYWLDRWKLFESAELRFEDFPFSFRKGSPRSWACDAHSEVWNQDWSARTRHFAGARGITMYAFLFATLATTLSRITGKDCIAVWCHFANRIRSEFHPLIGWFANCNLLGVDLSESPAACDILDQARQTVRDGLCHSEIPLPVVSALAAMVNSREIHPLTSDGAYISFDLISEQAGEAVDFRVADDLVVRHITLPTPRQFPALAITARDNGERLTVRIKFASDKFRRSDIAKLMENWRNVGSQIINEPSNLLSNLSLRC